MGLMHSIRRKVRLAIEVLPWGEDIFLRLNANRMSISYRGVFPSFRDAQMSIAKQRRSEYDEAFSKKKAAGIEAGAHDVENYLFDHDYPLIFWLKQVLGEDSRVIELGGSLGHLFFSIRQLLPLGEHVSWTVLELPIAVECGRRLAEEKGEQRLAFRDSADPLADLAGDVFVTAGTLQYMDSELSEICGQFKSLPRHVLVHTLPSHRDREFWTLQKLDDRVEVAYGVYSISGLKQRMAKLGYECVDQWRQDRQVRIPFHPEIQTEGYMGFYFRRPEASNRESGTA